MKVRLLADGQRGDKAQLFLDDVDISSSSRDVTIRAAIDSFITADIELIPKGLDVELEARCDFHIVVPVGHVLLKDVLDNGRERWRCVKADGEVQP